MCLFSLLVQYQRRAQQELIAKNPILILKCQLMAVVWNLLPVTVAMMMSLPIDIHIETLVRQLYSCEV